MQVEMPLRKVYIGDAARVVKLGVNPTLGLEQLNKN